MTTAIASPREKLSGNDAGVAQDHVSSDETAEAMWLRRHLALAPERDEEWKRRALLLQGRI